MSCGCSNGTTVQVVCLQTCTTLTPTVCQNQSVDISLITTCNSSLVYNILEAPAHGSLTVDTINKKVVYTPDEDYIGGDQIKVEILCDGDMCEQYLINITVKEVLDDGKCLLTLSGNDAECLIGDPSFNWSGFILGIIELHPESLPTDETIKIIVNCYHETANPAPVSGSITLKVCCGPCEYNCCKEVIFQWNPPIGVPNDCTTGDCSEYPCTVFDPETGNCITQCDECNQCCDNTITVYSFSIDTSIAVNAVGSDNFAYTGVSVINGSDITFSTPIYLKEDGIDVAENIWIALLESELTTQLQAANVTVNGDNSNNFNTEILITDTVVEIESLSLQDYDNITTYTAPFITESSVTSIVNSTCAECCNTEDCPSNQLCLNGVCTCPNGDLPQPDGTCPECFEDEDCPNCENCEQQTGTCIPFECIEGEYISVDNEGNCICVDCLQDTDCDFPCEICNQTDNTCVPAPTSCVEPITEECIICPDCGLVTHPDGMGGTVTEIITCPEPCEYCNNSECLPVPCQAGLIPNPNDPTTGSITIGNVVINCTPEQPCCCVENPCVSDPIELTDCLEFDMNMHWNGFTSSSTSELPELIYNITWFPSLLSGTPNLNGFWKNNSESVMVNPPTGNLPAGTVVKWEINFTKFVNGWIEIPAIDVDGFRTNGGTGVHIKNFIVGDGYLLRVNVLGRTITKEFFYDENTEIITERPVGTNCICIVGTVPQTWMTVNSVSYDVIGTAAALTHPMVGGQSDHLVFQRPGGNVPVTVTIEVSYANDLGSICTNDLVVVLQPCIGGPCCGVQSIVWDETFNSNTQEWTLHASVYGDDCNGNATTVLYTCAPPTTIETPGDGSELAIINTIAFHSGGTGNPIGYAFANQDNCGTLPNSNLIVDNLVQSCGPFNCNTNTNSPMPTAPCGWVTKDVRIDSLNGANIGVTINGDNPAVCFGVDTVCGYVCDCKSLIIPPEECSSAIKLTTDTSLLCSNDTIEICLSVIGSGVIDFTSLIWTGLDPISNIGNCFTFTSNGVSESGVTVGVTGNIIENGLLCPFQSTQLIAPNCPECTLKFGAVTYDCDTELLSIVIGGGCTNDGNIINSDLEYTYSYGAVTGSGTIITGSSIEIAGVPSNTVVTITITTICDVACSSQLIYTTDDCTTSCQGTFDATVECANGRVGDLIITPSNFINSGVNDLIITAISNSITLMSINNATNGGSYIANLAGFNLITGSIEITVSDTLCTDVQIINYDCGSAFTCPEITIPEITEPTRYVYTPSQILDQPFEIVNSSKNLYKSKPLTINNKTINKVLKNKDNVIGYSLGYKKTKGKLTGEKAIIITVSKKVTVDKKNMIPSKIGNFLTDVIEQGELARVFYTPCNCTSTNGVLTDCNCNGSSSGNSCTCLPHKNSFKINTSGNNINKNLAIGGVSGVKQGGTACTTTMVVKDSTDNSLVMLACNHCAGCAHCSGTPCVGGNNGVGIDYVQTSPNDVNTSNNSNIIGNIKRGYIIRPGNQNKLDSAVITLNSNTVAMPDVFQIGEGPFEWITLEELLDLFTDAPAEQLYIYKSGRTGGTYTPAEEVFISQIGRTNYGVSAGNCYNVDMCGNTPCAIFDDIIIASNSNNGWSAGFPGDSSSPIMIVHDNKIKFLGMLFAGNDDEIGIIPAYNLHLLNIEPWNGEVIVESNALSITINGREFNRVASTSLPITHIKD